MSFNDYIANLQQYLPSDSNDDYAWGERELDVVGAHLCPALLAERITDQLPTATSIVIDTITVDMLTGEIALQIQYQLADVRQ